MLLFQLIRDCWICLFEREGEYTLLDERFDLGKFQELECERWTVGARPTK